MTWLVYAMYVYAVIVGVFWALFAFTVRSAEKKPTDSNREFLDKIDVMCWLWDTSRQGAVARIAAMWPVLLWKMGSKR